MRGKVKPIILKYPTVPVAVDGIVWKGNKIVLVTVDSPSKPYLKGKFVLPGGFVKVGETTKNAVRREVREETGLKVKIIERVGVYDSPYRDPRGHVISIAYLCKAIGGRLRAGSDVTTVKLFSPKELEKLKFGLDHKKMLEDARIV